MKLATSIITVFAVMFLTVALSAQKAPDYTTEIQPILDAYCTSCHGWLTTYEQAMERVSTSSLTNGISNVVAGDAAASLLVWRLEGQTSEGTTISQMPKGDDPLSEAQLQLIRDWINAGALPEVPTSVEPRSWGQIKASL